MTASNQQPNVGQNFLDRALGALFSFGSGREGSPQRQAYDDIVKAQQDICRAPADRKSVG